MVCAAAGPGNLGAAATAALPTTTLLLFSVVQPHSVGLPHGFKSGMEANTKRPHTPQLRTSVFMGHETPFVVGLACKKNRRIDTLINLPA